MPIKIVTVDLPEPISKKSASERKEIREAILHERQEAFNILAGSE